MKLMKQYPQIVRACLLFLIFEMLIWGAILLIHPAMNAFAIIVSFFFIIAGCIIGYFGLRTAFLEINRLIDVNNLNKSVRKLSDDFQPLYEYASMLQNNIRYFYHDIANFMAIKKTESNALGDDTKELQLFYNRLKKQYGAESTGIYDTVRMYMELHSALHLTVDASVNDNQLGDIISVCLWLKSNEYCGNVSFKQQNEVLICTLSFMPTSLPIQFEKIHFEVVEQS